MALEIRQRDGDGIRILELIGQLDARAAGKLESTLRQCLKEGWQGLLVDLAPLELIDGTGLRVLVTSGERLEATGGRLTLCAAGADVMKVFDVARMSRHLVLHETRSEALQWLHKSVRVTRIARFASSLLRKTTPGAPKIRRHPAETERLELAARLLGLLDEP